MKTVIRLIVAIFLALTIWSCEQYVEDYSTRFEVEEDAAVLSQRITYINEALDVFSQNKKASSLQARLALASFDLTPQFQPEDDITTLIEGTYNNNLVINEGELVCVNVTGEFAGGITLNGGTFVVLGTANISWISGSKGTIINNPSGKIISNGFSLRKNITLANYGTIEMPEWATIALNGQIENYSELSARSLYINPQGKLYNSGLIFIDNSMAVNGVCHNYGTLNLRQLLYLNSSGELLNQCKTIVGKSMTHNGVLKNGAYLEIAERFYVNNNKGFEMSGGALVKSGFIIVNDDITSDGDENAVLYAHKKLTYNKGKIAENVILTTQENECIMPANDCSPGLGAQPRYTLLFEIEPPLFKGSLLSATCVQVHDNKAYVSYHMNGEDYGAAIDVLELDGVNPPQLIQTLYASDMDFNEFKIDDVLTNGKRKMWVMGAQRMTKNTNFESAAIALEMLLRDGVIFNFYHNICDLKGTSGNSIVKRGDELIAVSGSQGGLTVLDHNDFSPIDFVPLKNAKYFSCAGDDAISLTASAVDAVLRHYNADGPYNTPDVSATIDAITPYDGKLVVHLDDDKTYISCASQGLKAYNTQSLEQVGAYQELSSSTNCMTSDDDFVYLANGSDGLVILEKQGLSKIGAYAFEGSANFVSAFDNYIFLADGRGGFKVVYREQ